MLRTDRPEPIPDGAAALWVRPEVHLVIGFMKQDEVLVRVDLHVGYAEGPSGSGIQ